MRTFRERAVGESPMQAAREGSLGVIGKNGESLVESDVCRVKAIQVRSCCSEFGWYRDIFAPKHKNVLWGFFISLD